MKALEIIKISQGDLVLIKLEMINWKWKKMKKKKNEKN